MANPERPPLDKTILVIDDQAMARNTMRRTLEYYGFTVLEGKNSKEGLQVFNEQRSKIDMVMLDLNLLGIPPEKMLAALRTLDPQVKVAVSTDQQPADLKYREEFQKVVDVLRKPVRTDRLLAVVRQALDL